MSVKKKNTHYFNVPTKNLQLMCYPKCMHAYQIWIALFFQLTKKQQNYHLSLTLKYKLDIPILTTEKSDHYFFSSHFNWIYAYFYNKNKTEFKFRACEQINSYECIIQALNEVKSLLCSGLHHSIKGLDIIVHWLNEQYLPTHIHVVFGHKILTIEHLRQLSELSKFKSSTSLISKPYVHLPLENILAGIKS